MQLLVNYNKRSWSYCNYSFRTINFVITLIAEFAAIKNNNRALTRY